MFVLFFTCSSLFAVAKSHADGKPVDQATVDTPRIWVSQGIKWSYNEAFFYVSLDVPFPSSLLSKASIIWGDGQRLDFTEYYLQYLNEVDFQHSYKQPGTYRIQFVTVTTDPAQLPDTVSEVTLVVREPYVNLELGPDITIAEGDTLTVDAGNPGAIYQWSTGATTQKINVTAAGRYYAYVVKNGDDAADSILVTVKPRDSILVSRIGIDSVVCLRAHCRDSSFYPYPVVSRLWDFGDGSVTGLTNPVHVYSASGVYTITLKVFSSNGDSAVSKRTITINNLPAVDLGADTTLLAGDSLLLNAAQAASRSRPTYHWSTGDTTATIKAAAPGTYWVNVSYCANTVSDTIRLKDTIPDTQLKARINVQKTACSTVQFSSASTIASGHIVSWYWDFGDNTSDTSQNPAPHTYTGSGTRMTKLIVTDNYGHRDSAQEYFNINLPLYVELGADTLYMDVPGEIGYTLPQGPDYEYLWSTGATSYTINVSQSGPYWVRVTDKYCDTTAIDSTQIFIGSRDTLLARIGIDSINCNVVSFRDSSIAFPPVMKWEWDFGDGRKDTLRNPVHVYQENGQYTVSLKVTTYNGDTASVTRVLPLNNIPVLDLGADTTLLPGDSLLLDATKPHGSSWASYLWSTGQTVPIIKAAAPGAYWVKVSYCGSTVADTIHITTLPFTGIGGITHVNAEDSIAITAQFNHSFNSNNVFTVQLLRETSTGGKVTEEGEVTDIATIPGVSQSLALSVKVPDTIPCSQDYRIRVVSSSPADTTGWSSKFEVINMPLATIQQRGDSLFAGSSLGYQWYLDNAPIAGATMPYHRARANGEYKVIMNNGGNCRSTSSSLNVIITAITDVNEEGSGVKAFPNPTGGIVYIRFEKPLLKPVNITVYDTNGNAAYRKQLSDQAGQIDLSALPRGVYYLTITGYEKQKAMRIILQ